MGADERYFYPICVVKFLWLFSVVPWHHSSSEACDEPRVLHLLAGAFWTLAALLCSGLIQWMLKPPTAERFRLIGAPVPDKRLYLYYWIHAASGLLFLLAGNVVLEEWAHKVRDRRCLVTAAPEDVWFWFALSVAALALLSELLCLTLFRKYLPVLKKEGGT